MFSITDSEFKQLTGFIRSNYGINIKEERTSLVTGRLNHVLVQKKFHSFSDYYSYVISDSTGNAVSELLNKITTNHTFFMREADHFRYFEEKALPALRDKAEEKNLRIWSAGCSTGEEAYTLAMILDNFFKDEKLFWDTKILATDISGKVLKEAAEGIYTSDAVSVLPKQWIHKYFIPCENGRERVADFLKCEIIFRKLNLMENFPFRRKFHIIFCRNVMIYFEEQTRIDLMNRFYNALEPGGYLFIGHSESLNRDYTDFRYVMPAVYRKESWDMVTSSVM